MAKKKKPAGKKSGAEKKPAAMGKKAAGGKEKKQGQVKKKAGSAEPVKRRLLTPQEIIDYYRAHHKLPPELQRRAGK